MEATVYIIILTVLLTPNDGSRNVRNRAAVQVTEVSLTADCPVFLKD